MKKILAQSPRRDRRANNGKRDRARDVTRAQKHKKVAQILEMDTLYTRIGEPISPMSFAILIGITVKSAEHLCASMADDGKLGVVKRRDHRNCKVNWYCKPVRKLSAISWRKNPNFKPMPPYWQLGAPM